MQSHGADEYGSINDAIVEQLTMVDAAKRASAKRVTAVAPFYGYARQDRKSEGREPITAKLVANMFEVAGAKRLVSIDLHSGQIQGFFDGPVDHLTAMPVLAAHLAELDEDLVVVSPDSGRLKTAERYAKQLHAGLAFVYKRRMRNQVEALAVLGDVEGRTCVLIDDMIDTAGTMVAAAEQLIAAGAVRVLAACHPRRAVRSGHRPPQELADRAAGHHRHAAAPAREADRQDRGAVGGADPGQRHPGGLRRRLGERDLRRQQPRLTGAARWLRAGGPGRRWAAARMLVAAFGAAGAAIAALWPRRSIDPVEE